MRVLKYVLPFLALSAGGCVRVISHLSSSGDDLGGEVLDSPTATKNYDVADFTQIDASSAMEVEYATGSKTSVKVSAPSKAFAHIQVKCEDGALHLGMVGSYSMNGTIHVTITSPKLTAISLDGSVSGEFKGISTGAFSATVNGSSKANIEGRASSVKVEIDGSSTVSTGLRGAYGLTGTVNGSSVLRAGGTVNDFKMNADGSSRIEVAKLDARKASIELGGSSNLTATGSAKSFIVTTSGGSHAQLGGVAIDEATANADAGSDIDLGKTNTLTATAGGGSHVRYKGSPKLVKSESGGASVDQD